MNKIAQAQSDEWRSLYTERAAVVDYFQEAYNATFVKTLVECIRHLNKNQVDVLTVGGGMGNFSRNTLPRLRKALEDNRLSDVVLRVTESDIDPVIKRANARYVLVDVHGLDRKLTRNSFDLVVGESMIQIGSMKRFDQRMKQIMQVIRNGGMFIHVQDSIPANRELLEGLDLKDHELLSRADLPTICGDVNDIADEDIDAIHGALSQRIIDFCALNSYGLVKAELHGCSAAPERDTLDFVPDQTQGEWNCLQFGMGRLSRLFYDELESSERLVEYLGVALIVSKGGNALELAQYINNINEVT